MLTFPRKLCLSLVCWLTVFLSSPVIAQEARNPFLPTRAHIPKGQQLGVYFLPWSEQAPVLAVRFFLSDSNYASTPLN